MLWFSGACDFTMLEIKGKKILCCVLRNFTNEKELGSSLMNFGDDDLVGTTVEVAVDKVPPSLPTF